MLMTVLLVAAAWGLLALLGLALLASVAPQLRHALLPAAPLVGVTFLVAALHTTGLFLSVRRGLVVVLVLAVVVLVVGVRRGRARPLLDRPSAGWSLAGLALGIPFALVALAPSAILDSARVVSPSANNDAVWYVSVSSWLADHPITDVPMIPAAPMDVADPGVPGDGPAVSALTFPLRVGQELVQASLNTVTGTSPVTTFTPWLAVWVLLLPGGCLAAAALLRLGRAVGVLSGVVMASSVVLVQQVYNQNAASVLGIALAPLVLAGVVAALERDRRMPVLLAGLLLSGLVGTYSEYAPFVAPALVAALLLRRSGLGAAAARGAGVLLAAVAIAPLAWYRAVQGLIGVRGGAADAFPSPFRDAPLHVVLNRLVGVAPAGAGDERSWLAVLLAALVVAGVLLGIVLGPQRGLWLGLLGAALPFIVWLSVQRLGYTQRRAVEIVLPLVLFIAVVGWVSLVRRLSRRSVTGGQRQVRVVRWWAGAPVAVVLAAALLGSLVVFAGVNVRSSLAAFARADLAPRHVDSDFSEARQWVAAAGEEDVSVLVPSFFDQQWMTLALLDDEQVEYPAIRPDYFRTESFWSGGVDRYWLVGIGVQVDADPAVVVHANDRFRMLDLSRGEAVIAAPYGLTDWDTGLWADGGATTVNAQAQALVVRTPGTGSAVTLTLRAPLGEPVDVAVGAAGAPPVVVDDLALQPVAAPVELPAGTAPVLVDLLPEAPVGAAGPQRIEMAGVQRVP
ncbi:MULTISPECIES: hypothetical protein [unclassified Modestobacter]|uniref:hypothetical protein n=1 Tax=unclassified Modestobacter TaxID=2643866 RepID=UPI0022AB1532|nr:MULTISPECIES: hypothetical protein [unclassified Modestobacter]MCZ2823774.1 hypothetical protein [Modestobacter sp. VKM Ac-2981]MCZ2852019.1 hypothetical protein [Modestobacter sp. VKM Ac-2982]